jgi:hypothetical protein
MRIQPWSEVVGVSYTRCTSGTCLMSQQGAVQVTWTTNRPGKETLTRKGQKTWNIENKPGFETWLTKKRVVTHIACATVDIFDHYEITVSWPVGERYGGKEVMGAGAWAW